MQALFISWWGWGDSDLDGVIEGNPDAYLNRGITALLDQLAAMTSTQRIRAALIVEPFVWTQPRPRIEPRTLQPAQRAMVLDWLWINYHGKDKYREDDLLYGWNLYDEQAYIEPAVATPPRPSIGYSYVDRTCDYWQTLRAGRALGPPSRCIYIPQVTGEAAK